MADFSTFRYFLPLFLLIFHFKTLKAAPNSTFSFKNFNEMALYGDVKVINGGSSVQFSGFLNSTGGRLIYKKPIKLVNGNPRKFTSFSTYFVFSMSQFGGDGLGFSLFPIGFPLDLFDNSSFGIRVFGIKFITHTNHVGIDIDGLVSDVKLVLNSGENLQIWIDYESGSKRFEVRLSKLGHPRPVDPLVWYPIELSKVWKKEAVFVGLSSLQKCNVYSWSFKIRRFEPWIHSQPLNPEVFDKETKVSNVRRRTTDCLLKVLAVLVFGTGCGAIGAFVVLFFWITFERRRSVMVEEFVVHPVKFEYEKFKVVVDNKGVEDGKK